MIQVEISITFTSLSPVIAPNKWILLLYGLPTKKGAARVNLWRQLKKCGALPLKTSAYLLPDKPEHHERLQWLAQQVRDGGGEATIIHVTEIEGLPSEDIVRQFNEARATDYAGLLSALSKLMARNRRRPDEQFTADLEELTRQFDEIRKFEVEFSHHSDDCTFETLAKRFGIADKAVLKIAEMVHDADLEDAKFQTAGCVGIDQVLKGWAKSGLSDEELLKRGGECFEALYQQLRK